MNKLKKIIRTVCPYLAVFAIVWFLSRTVFMLAIIPSSSMENTIQTGDLVLATRYDKKNIERYDIMIFHTIDEPDTYMIKRVIGLPGETIEIMDGKVYVDGVELEDDFILEDMKLADDYYLYEVPEGSYFMLGDNRNNSSDSRYWTNKYVPIGFMDAKAKCILLPFSSIGMLK